VVEGLHTEWTDQSYAVSGSVVNDRTVSLTRVQLIITVRGELETVTGFRVIDLLDENHELLPDERLPFSVRITPLDGETGQGVIVEAHGSAAIQ